MSWVATRSATTQTDPAVARDTQFLPDAALAEELGLP